MAAQRARQKAAPPTEPEAKPPRNRVFTGAERYTDDNEINPVDRTQLKLQTVLTKAKSSGKLNLSSRDLKTIPSEVWDMYHVDPNKIVVDFGSSGDAWYDNEELTKFIAADNQLEYIDERIGQEFGALTSIDLRSNLLKGLPDSIAQLQLLTNLNLSHNQLEAVPSCIYKLPKLRELDLAHNRISSLSPDIANLEQIETLILNDNELQDIPDAIGQLAHIRKLHLSHNKVTRLPTIEQLSPWKKLVELLLVENKLSILFEGKLNHPSGTGSATFPSLARLDARQNNLDRTVSNADTVSTPALRELFLAHNELTDDPASLLILHGCPELQTLDISSNLFSEVPDAVLTLTGLQRLDVSACHLRGLRSDLGKLEHLAVLKYEGNPLRSAPRNVTMAELIESLRVKMNLEEEESTSQPGEPDNGRDGGLVNATEAAKQASRAEERAPAASYSHPTSITAPVKVTGTLNLARKEIKALEASHLAESGIIPATLQLGHNLLIEIPPALSDLKSTLVHLNLEHNRLREFSVPCDFPSLKTLNLSNNRITRMAVETEQLPQLNEINLNFNMLSALPENLAACLPALRILRANSNKIENISANMFENMEIIDLGNNDIGLLPPELGAITSIRELMVYGNRFRVPRPAVLDQGTQAILEFLRRRLGA
ncbi:hypothetical protein BCR43DRAFT_434119 [Syncephalastrum racemosum]|uniref:Leucine-rich repeat-containing protein 40 n=1 Tax=Syncephalastrum racemosum TaxID=13706 RepID=A0A1X2HQB8_SYNRA|nr:hypothetical protein BCR43DRAFT_434119 [Syncephalastrum racemosum]